LREVRKGSKNKKRKARAGKAKKKMFLATKKMSQMIFRCHSGKTLVLQKGGEKSYLSRWQGKKVGKKNEGGEANKTIR